MHMNLLRIARHSSAMIMSAIAVLGYASAGNAQTKPKTSVTTAQAAKPAPAVEPPLWPVNSPTPLPGAMLPAKRIVAFYGNPLSKRMGILGELEPDDMLAKLEREVDAKTHGELLDQLAAKL